MDELLDKYADIPANQRYGGLVMILLFIGVSFYMLSFEDKNHKVEVLQAEVLQKETQRNQKQSVAQNRAAYEKKLLDLQKQLDQARAQLPDDANIGQLISQLSSRGQEVGIVIDKYRPLEETDKKIYSELGFELDIKGSYHEIGLFVDAISKLDRIIGVRNIDLQMDTEPGNQADLKSRLILVTFRYVPKK